MSCILVLSHCGIVAEHSDVWSFVCVDLLLLLFFVNTSEQDIQNLGIQIEIQIEIQIARLGPLDNA